jgi:uncharacterized membrane protein YidH (DUF202 family)
MIYLICFRRDFMPSTREKQIYKIIMITSGIIALGVAGYLAVAMFMGAKNYFTAHFAIPIVLVCVGVIALCMPQATRSRFGSDAKDNVMKIVAVLLILFAILTLVLSYFDFFQF